MKTKKNKIRLTENELKRVITESVKKVLNEDRYDIYHSGVAVKYHRLKDKFFRELQEIIPEMYAELEMLHGAYDSNEASEDFNNTIGAEFENALQRAGEGFSGLDAMFELQEIPPYERMQRGIKQPHTEPKHNYGKLG